MIAIHPLRGGIHPPEHKARSTSSPIVSAVLPAELVLPLQQHVGAAAVPLVAVGDTVLKGQCIAAARPGISAALHSPVSGRVVAIELRLMPHPSGMTDTCIVIVPDGLETWRERKPITDPLRANPETLRARIREAGICGLGGAGFPTDIKLTPRGRSVDTLILNAAECEPYITADDALLRERADEVVKGLELLVHLLRPRQTLIGIEDNKPQAIAALRAALQDSWLAAPAVLSADASTTSSTNLSKTSSTSTTLPMADSSASAPVGPCEIVVIPTRYPSGGERQLIQILTGREVPHGGLPADLGMLCQNVGTVAAIHRAVYLDEPLISRITTVTGNAVARPGNYDVLIGTPVDHLLAQAGLDPARLHRLIMGGPMMGFTLPATGIPVVKTTNCLLAADREEFPDPPPEQPCIRCGFCAEVCPAQLLPQQLLWFAKAQEFDKAERYHLADCIECGACAYVCPSSIPLVQYYRYAKGETRRLNEEKRHSDRARERFESRKARLEKEQAEKESRRKARADAAAAQQRDKTAEEGH